MALTGSKMKWETRSALMSYVKEAKGRGLSIADCRLKLGLEPLPPPVPEAEEQREEAGPTTQQKTQTALLAAPPVPVIVVDKAELENDDHLKAVIKKYFNKWKFLEIRGLGRVMEIVSVEDLSVKSISGSTFITDIHYRYEGNFLNRLGMATSNIEKTANSYRIISFDIIW